jgi:hypothetical protein
VSEDRDGEVVALRRDLAAAVRSGDRARVRAVKAQIERLAGLDAGKEHR